MRKKWLPLLGVLVVGIIVGSTLFLTVAPGEGPPITPVTPEEIGAFFLNSSMRPIAIKPKIAEEQAREIALQQFMGGFDVPLHLKSVIKGGVVIKSTSVSFSGSRHGQDPWTIHDRPAWIVVLHDIPASLPCGVHIGPRPDNWCQGVTPKYHVAIDSETGEILSTELTGGGPRNEKWSALLNQGASALSVTEEPTSVPVQ